MEIKVALLETEKQKIKVFLEDFNLGYDQDIDYSLYCLEGDRIVGTISLAKNIIKSFAIAKSHQGELASKLISEAINYLYQKGINYYQVYTKPQNKEIFEALNFREIITTDQVCLLESRNRDISKFLQKIKDDNNLNSDDVGCLVMNCNPFTLGHRYLIEQASHLHDALIVFILEEEQSTFSFEDRISLVRAGTNDLENVRIIPSSNYLISSLTFPTYFLKQDSIFIEEQAKVDSLLFKKYFIPIFNLKRRYLGTETDLVTAKYNQVLQRELSDFIKVIPRLQVNGQDISASKVRHYLAEKEFTKIKKLVPSATYEFLKAKYE